MLNVSVTIGDKPNYGALNLNSSSSLALANPHGLSCSDEHSTSNALDTSIEPIIKPSGLAAMNKI